jgi:Zn-dependent protease with chaperone function
MATVHAVSPFNEKLSALCTKLSLTNEQFETLSKKAELELKEAPAQYRLKVFLLAFSGYAFIGLVVAFLLGILLSVAYFFLVSHHAIYGLKFVLVIGAILWVVVKALWIKNEPPSGIVLAKKEAPELFRLLDELASKLGTRVDKVLVNADFNACVVQLPRMGFLDVYSNYLMLGLPLMLTHTPDQFKAVLSHELGHLSGNHSKSSAWIYNLRRRWGQLLQSIEASVSPGFFAPFYLFFSWFLPRFEAYTLAMARQHELEADAEAVKITGPIKFCESMLLLPIHEEFLNQKFWPGVIEEAKTTAEPVKAVYDQLQAEMAKYNPENEQFVRLLGDALNEEGSGGDTHPPLKVRLTKGLFEPVLVINGEGNLDTTNATTAEIVAEIRKPLSQLNSSAKFFLGGAFAGIVEELNVGWREAIQPQWEQRHQFYIETNSRINEIDEEITEKGANFDLLKEKAWLVAQVEDVASCRPIYREILALAPHDPATNYNLGVSLLLDKEEEGLTLLEKAIAGRRSLIGDACPHMVGYLTEHGRLPEAEAYKKLLVEFDEEMRLARKERMSVDGKSELEPHELDNDTVDYLNRVFEQVPDVSRVWAARKKVQYFSDSPYIVLGVDAYEGSIHTRSEEKLALAKSCLDNLQMPHEFCVTVFEMGSGALKKKIAQVPDALIYKKAGK